MFVLPTEDAPHTDSTRTHAGVRGEARGNAMRKARVLFKHRSALIRWTADRQTDEDNQVRPPPQLDVKNAATATRTETNQNGQVASAEEIEFVRRDLLRLASSERLGRHLVAEASIPAGTVLIRERPFAWCIEPEFAAEFCAHCLREVRREQVRLTLFLFSEGAQAYRQLIVVMSG